MPKTPRSKGTGYSAEHGYHVVGALGASGLVTHLRILHGVAANDIAGDYAALTECHDSVHDYEVGPAIRHIHIAEPEIPWEW